MKVRLRRDTEIIHVERDFAILDGVTDEHFHYLIKYRVFPSRAIAHNVMTCAIQLSRIPFTKTEKKVFTSTDPEEVTKNLLLQAAKRADLIRSEEEEWFQLVHSDFTKRIPKTSLREMRRGEVEEINDYLMIPARELTLDDTLAPVLDTATNRVQAGTPPDGIVFRELAVGLLERNIDPASYVASPTNAIISSDKAISGALVKGNCNCDDRNISKDRLLIESLLSERQKVESQKDNIRPDDLVRVSRRVRRDYIEVTERIAVAKSDLSGVDTFYIGFRAMNNKGLCINTVSAPVQHNRLIHRFHIPTKAPTITAARVKNTPRVIVEVKQNDKNGSSIQIYRRKVNALYEKGDAEYEFVAEVPARISDGIRTIEDNVSTEHHVIYRAISVNDSEAKSAEFGSVVIGKRNQESMAVSVIGSVEVNSIVVKVGNIPTGVVSVEVRRTDKTLKLKNETHIGLKQVVDEPINFEVAFEDNDVKLFRVYEYSAYLYYKNGSIKKSPVPCIIEYNPISKNVIDITTSAPSVVQSGNQIDVQFSITKNVIQNDMDALRSFLNQQGFLGEYQDEIIANREKIRDLFGIEVLRTDLSTGEVESFGVITTDDFSDSSLGPPSGVKPLVDGKEYIYTLKAHARTIETLFPSLTREVQTGPNSSYDLAPAKWHHPATLTIGNIVSDGSLKRNHAKSSFTFGSLCDVKEVRVSIPVQDPSIIQVTAASIGDRRVEVQWKMQGDVNKIDHFIVILEYMGMKTIVGKSHNTTETGYFSFIDTLDNGESGRLTYSIVPVLYDYSRGSESRSNSVVVR